MAYFTHDSPFIANELVRSSAMNTKLDSIAASFALLSSDTELNFGTSTYSAETGSGNAYEIALPKTPASYIQGMEVAFEATHTNTGAATLNVNSIGTAAIVTPDGSALAAGDILTGRIVVARYDGTSFQLVSPQISSVTASAASAAAAAASAAAASASASAASTSETNAASSESLAQEWAENPEDTAITGNPGSFSAFHWAQKAAASTTQGSSTDLPSAPGTFNANLSWYNANLVELADVGFNSDTTLLIANRVYGGFVTISATDSGGTLQSMIVGTPGTSGTVGLYGGGELRGGVSLTGVAAIGNTLNDPGTGGTQNARYELGNAALQSAGLLGYDFGLSTTLQLSNYVHGGAVTIGGESSAGTFYDVAEFSAQATGGYSVRLSYTGNEVLRLRSDGIQLLGSVTTDPTTGGTQDTYVQLSNRGGTVIGHMGYESSANLEIVSNSHGSNIELHGEDSSGVLQTLLTANPDGSALLYHSGSFKAGSTSSGFAVLGATSNDPTAGGTQDPQLQFQNSSFAVGGFVGFPTSGSINLEMRNQVHGGAALLRVENSSGTSQVVFQGFPDGSSRLFHTGTQKLDTATTGVDIRGSLSNDPALGGAQDTLLEFSNSTGSRIADIGFNGSNDNLEIYSRSHGGAVVISTEGSAGAKQNLVAGFADAGTFLYYNGSSRLSTTTNGIDVTGNIVCDTSVNISGATPGLYLLESDTTDENAFLVNDGGAFQVQQRDDALGFVQTSLSVDHDGATILKYAGTNRFSTGGSGNADVRSDSSPGISASQLVNIALTQADGVEVAKWGLENSTTMIFRNKVHGGSVAIQGEQSDGTVVTMFTASPDGDFEIWDAGERRLDSEGPNAIRIHPEAAQTTEGGELQLVGASTEETISIDTVSGQLRFFNQDTSDMYIRCFPDAAVQLYYDNAAIAITRNDGVSVRGSLNNAIGGTQDTYVLLEDSDGTDIASYGFISSAALGITNFNHGGHVIIQAEDAGGTMRTLFDGDPDDDVALFDDGTEVARTLPAASGGWQVNNTSTGSGFERVLTESDTPRVLLAFADAQETRTSTTTLTASTELTVSSVPTGFYRVEFFAYIDGFTSIPKFKFDGGATFTGEWWYSIEGTTGSSATGEFSSNETVSGLGDGGKIHVVGYIDLTVSGTFALHWAQETSSGDATTLLAGSHMMLTRLGDT